MYTRAVLNDLQFFSTSKGIYESVRDGELVLLPITMDLTLDKVAYPFVLPRTRDAVNVFAKLYHQTCGERLVVTSGARPRTEQPRNASPQSVHPTGMAVDFRKPAEPCLSFMRKELLALEQQGILEATEEKHPVHFHVAVLQRGKFAPVNAAVASATATVAPSSVMAAVATGSSTTAPVVTTVAAATAPLIADSAAGSIEPTPAAKTPAKTSAKTYTVKKGDTLSEIAKRFGLSITRLKSLNAIHGSVIQPGKKLRVG